MCAVLPTLNGIWLRVYVRARLVWYTALLSRCVRFCRCFCVPDSFLLAFRCRRNVLFGRGLSPGVSRCLACSRPDFGAVGVLDARFSNVSCGGAERCARGLAKIRERADRDSVAGDWRACAGRSVSVEGVEAEVRRLGERS